MSSLDLKSSMEIINKYISEIKEIENRVDKLLEDSYVVFLSMEKKELDTDEILEVIDRLSTIEFFTKNLKEIKK